MSCIMTAQTISLNWKKRTILGNMAKRDDTNHQLSEATSIFYLSDSDIEGLDTLVKEGFEVIFQQVPSAGRTTWDNFKKTL